MSNVDKTLVGSNFCGLECSNKNNPIHPQTCTSQVLKTHDSNFTLVDWINYKTSEESVDKTFQRSASLLDWLTTNYPIESKSIPIADNDTIGGIKLGENNKFLQITDGVLTFKDSSLPSVEKASFETLGAIKLGNDSIMEDVEFNSSLYPITEEDYHCFPLVRDHSNDHRAGIAIPKVLFNSTQVQVNWNESDSTSLSYILNKPTIPEAYVLPMASDASLGGIKVGYVSTENNKAVNINASGEAYVQLKVPAGAWVGNGLSQHYFEISYSQNNYYVPLFKIEKNEPNNDFKVNIRFEIIGRHTASYFGEFMINYRNEANYPKDLLMLNLVAPANARLAQNDIVATVNDEGTEMIVYRRMDATTGLVNRKENFIVNVTGNNARGATSSVDINTMTYYCTEIYEGNGNEVLLNDTTTDPDSAILTTAPTNGLTYVPAITQN